MEDAGKSGESNRRRLSRRGFIAAGAALGGSVLWSDRFAWAGSDAADKLRALRQDVKDSNVEDNLKGRILQRLARAKQALELGATDTTCYRLDRAIDLLELKKGTNGLSKAKANSWIARLEDIKDDAGCGATGPTGPTGATGPTGETGP